MFRAGGHDIDPCGINIGMAEDVCQFGDVLFNRVEGSRKQMTKVMRKDLLGRDSGALAEFLHFPPDVTAIDGVPVTGYEYGTGGNFLFCRVLQ